MKLLSQTLIVSFLAIVLLTINYRCLYRKPHRTFSLYVLFYFAAFAQILFAAKVGVSQKERGREITKPES